MATIQKRGKSYRIKVSCGYDSKGKQVIQCKTWKPELNMTRRQIEKELQRQMVLFEEECLKGQVTATVKFQAVAEEWLNAPTTRRNLRDTTYARYLQLEKRTYSAIGHLRLDKVKTRDLQLFIDSLSRSGVNKSTGKSLAPKTIQLYHGFISNVFNYAIRMQMLTDNPCSRVTLPKREKKEKPIYTREQTVRFLELLQYEPLEYQVFFTIAIYSGLRRGELLGIEWKDISWHNGVIKISRTSNYTKHRGIFTDKTKTERSKRLVKLPLFLMPMLREHQDAQDRERERLGNLWEETDRLFTRWNGSPMSPQIPYQWLRKFCNAHGFPFYGVHHFRHLFASLSLDETKDIAVVSSALGHTNPNITLSVYSHLLEDVQDKIPNAMAKALNFVPKQRPNKDQTHKSEEKENRKTAV